MRLVAFFRNLNLGQRLAPPRDELERAFLEAGAHAARSFQTNGTVVFEARSLRSGLKILRGASEHFERSRGFIEPGFVRTWDHLAALVARQPFASDADPSVHAYAVTFLHDETDPNVALPRQTARGDVRVVEYTGTEMLCASYMTGANTAGNPNAWAERLFGLPATTRVWGTLERLLLGDGIGR